MSDSENAVIIDSGKVIIIDRKKPMRVLFYFAMALFGLQAIFEVLAFQRTGAIYHLVFGGILAFLLGLFVSRELFFRTYRSELDLNEISAVTIQRVPFGRGNVYLKFKLNNKTRVVFIDRHRAVEVKREIDPLK